MFFCDINEIFKSNFFTEYFWFFRLLPKNGINWGNNDFNANNEHIFVCCDNFKAFIQNNLTKSWRFSWEMSVAGFRYSETIVFGIYSNFTYDKSSRSQVLFKMGSYKEPSDLQLH